MKRQPIAVSDTMQERTAAYRRAAARKQADVHIDKSGWLFIFALLTPKAKAWTDDNVEVPDYMWTGESFVCEHRYALDLAQAMLDAGLKVT